jgi:hypothetical protein
VLQNPSAIAGDVAWCEDYLGDSSQGKLGSCCRKDDEWSAWCEKVRVDAVLLTLTEESAEPGGLVCVVVTINRLKLGVGV